MATPSEIKRTKLIESCVNQLSNAVVSRYMKRAKSSIETAGCFYLRLSPTITQVKAGKTGVAGYDPTNSDTVHIFREACKILSSTGAINVRMSKTGKSVEGLDVTPEGVDECYERIGQTPVVSLLSRAISLLDDMLVRTYEHAWVSRWAVSVRNELIGNASTVLKWGDDLSKLETLIKLLVIYDEVEKPVPIRYLSVRALSNSKALKDNTLASFLKCAYDTGEIARDLSQDDALLSLGIIPLAVSYVGIAGRCTAIFDGFRIPLNYFGPEGMMVNREMASHFSFVGSIKLVLIIENYTNFLEISRLDIPNVLCVFGSGRANKALLKLASRLDEVLEPSVPILAWSDVDLGGFEIVTELMKNCKRLKPFLMDGITVRDYKRFCLTHDDEYFDKLQAYLDGDCNECFREVGRYLLRRRITLEQECLLDGFAQERIFRLVEKLNGRAS